MTMFSKLFQKPAVNSELAKRTPPGQSLTERFPVLTYGPVPRVEADQVSIRVFGEVESEVQIPWATLMQLPMSTQTHDIHCVTHWTKLDMRWTGVSVPEIMKLIQLKPSATHVMMHCYGGYTTNLPLEDFIRPENLFSHIYDDQPLSAEHGGPMRIVVPHLFFWKSPKWISGLEFMSTDRLGFWEKNGYHKRGDPWREERYSND